MTAPDDVLGPGPLIVSKIDKPPGVEKSGFFNPRNPSAPYEIVLRRVVENGGELFQLREPIGYWDAEVGGVIVPADLDVFRTDLTSVPQIFTWLVPKSGTHLPAALVHDGLVHKPEEPQTYVADQVIDRSTADRIFRDGMRDLGATWVLRWLVWTAVATATMVEGPARKMWRNWLVFGLTVLIIATAGTAATIDLFDCRAPLPWMADRPWWQEVLHGGMVAVVVPFVLSPLWGRMWRAGVVAGIALALLLHVTFAVAVVFAVFNAIESIFERRLGRGLGWLCSAVAMVALMLLIGFWACG